MVHPKVGNTVPHEEVHPSIGGADIVEDRAGHEKAQVAEDNELGILGLVQRAGRVEVVDTTAPAVLLALTTTLGLLLVVVVTGDVGKKIEDPAEQLLADHVGGSRNRSLLHELAELVDGLADAGGILAAGLGDKDHVTGQVTGGLVVLAVRDLPGEVRDQKQGVADPANSVVQHLGRREGLVTALMGQHPHTGSNETLNDSVDRPESHTSRHGGDGLRGDIVVEEIKDGSQDGHVTEDIVQTGDGGAVVAVGRNGITDLLDGEVGDLEFIAVCVQHL